jgi:hypothetical protein
MLMREHASYKGLTEGDLFRVDGDRTVFRFLRYVERGAMKWVEARSDKDGYFRALYVGRRPIKLKTGLRLSARTVLLRDDL